MTLTRRRRSEDERIEALEAEIARLKALKEQKQSQARREAKKLLKAIGKAQSLAEKEGDGKLDSALSKALSSIEGALGGAISSKGGRVRRTSDQLESLKNEIADFVRLNPDCTMGDMSSGLNESSKDLRGPVNELLSEGVLKKRGQRRGTRYSSGATAR